MIIAQNGFRDEELLDPKAFFEKEKFEVIIAAPQKGLCKGMLGTVVQATHSLSEVTLNKVQAVVVVGGAKSPTLMEEPLVGDILLQAKENKLVVGAICLAPMVVASFGIINGMHTAMYKTEDAMAMLKKHGVGFLDESVVVDDWYVSGNGPSVATKFAENVVETIKN